MNKTLAIIVSIAIGGISLAGPAGSESWPIDDVRAGMKGRGLTVIRGTKIEPFDAEVVGVLRNTSPGRDLILCRLTGLNLEKTGTIAGMSGSPIRVNGKLLGAVAYAWPYQKEGPAICGVTPFCQMATFADIGERREQKTTVSGNALAPKIAYIWPYGKEPIAGITPFAQMREFVLAYEKRELAEQEGPRRVGLAAPLHIGAQTYDTVTVASDYDDPQPAAADGLWLVPLRTPVMTSGMSPRSLRLLGDQFGRLGMVPMQGGAAGCNIPPEERNIPLQAGGALSVALITGDFDMSGIGTVTHVDGKRVYGWGHPFMGMGVCDLPLMTGYVHTIYPRQSLSFKMGSPLRVVGSISADVSTCIAGWLDRVPDMLPVKTTVLREPAGESRTFNVKVVRQRQMLSQLVQMALLNSLDMEGDLPDEMTARVKVRIEVEGQKPLVLEDVYSGPNFSGTKGPPAMFQPVGIMLQQLSANNFQSLRVKSIDCMIEVLAGRRTAEIEGAELESDTLAPGDTLRATVLLRPFKGQRQRVTLSLPLPVDLPDGSYSAHIGDDLNNVRAELRDNPHLNAPQTLPHLFEGLELLLSARRTNLVLRVPTQAGGVAVNGTALPDLPPGMVQVLSSNRRSGTQLINAALAVRRDTGWVVQGNDTLRFQVSKNKQQISN